MDRVLPEGRGVGGEEEERRGVTEERRGVVTERTLKTDHFPCFGFCLKTSKTSKNYFGFYSEFILMFLENTKLKMDKKTRFGVLKNPKIQN